MRLLKFQKSFVKSNKSSLRTRLAQSFEILETNILDHDTSFNMDLPFIRKSPADLDIWYFLITHCIRFEKYSALSKRVQIFNINLAQECFHVCKNILKFALLPTTISTFILFRLLDFWHQLGWVYRQCFTCSSSAEANRQ